MNSSPLIVSLNGSPSATSRTQRLLEHLAARLSAQAYRLETVHVRELPAEALLHAAAGNERVARALGQVERAAVVVIGTPIYKAAYSGLLKTFLDLLPRDGLRNKIVLPLASGGSAAHTLALDYALRPVLAALGAQHVLPSIFAVESQVRWSEDSGLDLDADLRSRLNEGVERITDALPPAALVAPAVPPSLKLVNIAALQRC